MSSIKNFLSKEVSIQVEVLIFHFFSLGGLLGLSFLYLTRDPILSMGDHYLLFLFLVLSLGGLFFFDSLEKQRVKRWELFFWIGLSTIVLISRILIAEEKSIWPDEGYHLFFNERFLPLLSASRQVNPPLASIFNSFSVEVLGFSEMSSRLFSQLTFSFSIFVIFSVLKKLKVNFLFSCFLTSFYIFHPLALLFSVEARAIVPGLLILLLLVSVIHDVFKNSFDKRALFFLFGFQLMFFLTLGFQPYFVGLAAGIYFLLLSRSERKFFFASMALLLAFLVFYPIQSQIVSSSKFYFKDIYPGVIEDWGHLNFREGFYSLWIYFARPYLWILPIVGLALADRLYLKKAGSILDSFGVFLIGSILGVWFFFYPLLFLFIRETIQVYYFISIYLLGLIFLGHLCSRISLRASSFWGVICISWFFFLVGGVFVRGGLTPDSFPVDFYRPNIRSAIKRIAVDANHNGSFFLSELCIRGSYTWCPDEPYYVNLYLTNGLTSEVLGESIFPRSDILKFYRDSFERSFRVQTVYFLFHDMKLGRRKKALQYLNLHVIDKNQEIFESEGFLVWKIPSNQLDSRQDVISGMKHLENLCVGIGSDCFWLKGYKALALSSMERKGSGQNPIDLFQQEFSQSSEAHRWNLEMQRFLDISKD